MKKVILFLLFAWTVQVLGASYDDVTREKNELNRELYTGGNSPERIKEIKGRLWKLDEDSFQVEFKQAEKNKNRSEDDKKILCKQYKYRKTELDRGLSTGYIENDSKASGLQTQYEKGIKENCM
jgi:hypothetical protein